MIEFAAMFERCKKQSNRLHGWLIVSLLLGLAACGPTPVKLPAEPPDSGEVGTPSQYAATPVQGDSTPDDIAAVEISEATPEPAINPLTGLPVADAGRLTRRPILIKVTLYPRNNRPQWGLSKADLVFEHYTEGGLSRFSALFYGQEAEIVGPIRSARLIDIQLVRMYGALFAYGSADQRVLDQIDNSEFAERAIREFPAGCPPLCRIDPTVQNHLVTDTKALQDFYSARGIDLTAPDLSGMSFSVDIPDSGQAGLQLEIGYSADDFHRWRYEPSEGSYLRFQESGEGLGQVVPLLDRTTGEQIQTPNVVLLKVPHELYARTPEIVDIQLYGEGEGVAFRDGQAFEIHWIRPYPSGTLYLTVPDGSAYPLKPGTTWFELIGSSSQIDPATGSTWKVIFDMP